MSEEKKGFIKRWFGPAEAVPEQRSENINADLSSPVVLNALAETDDSSNHIEVRQALDIPEIAAALRIYTTAVSQLSMTVERTRQGVTAPYVNATVVKPDQNRSQSAFFKRTVTDLFLYGNAYWRIVRNSDGSVAPGGVSVLDPTRIDVKYANGTKYYEYHDEESGKRQRLTNNTPTSNGQVEHIRLAEIPGEVLGLGPIQMNNRRLAKIKAQLDFYNDFLKNAKRPSGFIVFDDYLDDRDTEQVNKAIDQRWETGRPIPLGKGAKWTNVMFNAEQAALVEMKNAATLDIARITGIPARKLEAAVEGNSLTYQNLGQADRAWVRESLEAYLTAIEDAMTNVIPLGQSAQFDTDNWLRAAESIAPTTEKEAAPVDDAA